MHYSWTCCECRIRWTCGVFIIHTVFNVEQFFLKNLMNFDNTFSKISNKRAICYAFYLDSMMISYWLRPRNQWYIQKTIWYSLKIIFKNNICIGHIEVFECPKLFDVQQFSQSTMKWIDEMSGKLLIVICEESIWGWTFYFIEWSKMFHIE